MRYPITPEEVELLRRSIIDDMKARQASGETGLDAFLSVVECQHEFEPVESDGELLFCRKCKFFNSK